MGTYGILVGWLLGLASVILRDGYSNMITKWKIKRLLRYEIEENQKQPVNGKNRTDFLHSDMYKANLGDLHLLSEKNLKVLLKYYKYVQRFENIQMYVHMGQPQNRDLLPREAKNAHEAGIEALELL